MLVLSIVWFSAINEVGASRFRPCHRKCGVVTKVLVKVGPFANFVDKILATRNSVDVWWHQKTRRIGRTSGYSNVSAFKIASPCRSFLTWPFESDFALELDISLLSARDLYFYVVGAHVFLSSEGKSDSDRILDAVLCSGR